MQIRAVSGPLESVDVDALILAYTLGTDSVAPWDRFDNATSGLIAEAVSSAAFTGKVGSCLAVPLRGAVPCREVLLVGLGKADTMDIDSWRRAIGTAASGASKRGASRLAIAVPPEHPIGSPDELAAAAAEALVLATYRFAQFKAPDSALTVVQSADLLVAEPVTVAQAVERAVIGARAACWARDLINTSPSDKRPPQLAEMAAEMADNAGLRCEVIDEAGATELGLHALLAVARGSSVGPRMVVIEHAPDGVQDDPIVLVGKGVTFDTGGISIKAAGSMDEMKADMSGAAAVLATMRAIAELQLPMHVCAVVPMAENMADGDSYRPGDLIRSYGGTTIEVLNTDAEGRLILADALAYARQRFDPECMVDLATLTGACVVALGNDVAGLMDNNDPLANELFAAGQRTSELVWRLPMWPHYRQLIDSRVADIKNTGGRWGGAISAAKFLEEFVGDTPWAHLDIAGPAYSTETAEYRPRGGTGFGVRLLLSWLSARLAAPERA